VRILFLALLLIAGCAPNAAQLPAYRWSDTQTAVNDLRARAESVHTISAECTITLNRTDGETAQLDGAIAMQNPGYIRLRSWKFNRAVFDLTLKPEGLWVMTLDDPKRKKQVLPASVSAADFLKQWAWFNGEMFRKPNLQSRIDGHTLVLKADSVICEVHRATLTPRRYLFTGDGSQFELLMDRYVSINGILWPTLLTASGPMGKIVIEQRNVELNTELAPNAFVPPRRAEKRR
jgi:hypothetical protein